MEAATETTTTTTPTAARIIPPPTVAAKPWHKHHRRHDDHHHHHNLFQHRQYPNHTNPNSLTAAPTSRVSNKHQQPEMEVCRLGANSHSCVAVNLWALRVYHPQASLCLCYMFFGSMINLGMGSQAENSSLSLSSMQFVPSRQCLGLGLGGASLIRLAMYRRPALQALKKSGKPGPRRTHGNLKV